MSWFTKLKRLKGSDPHTERIYAQRVITAVDILLEKCSTKDGRKAIANETGIDEKLILKWTNHADLFRIDGIGPQFAELLEKAGVDTVKELRTRNADNLYAKIVEINEKMKLVRRLPSKNQIA